MNKYHLWSAVRALNRGLSPIFAVLFLLALFVLTPQSAHAADYTLNGQASCEAAPLGGIWSATEIPQLGIPGNTCRITTAPVVIAAGDTLTIENVTLLNSHKDGNSPPGGGITNYGIVVIKWSGTLANTFGGVINNYGTIQIDTFGGTLEVGVGSTLNNRADGVIDNNWEVSIDTGIVNNDGTINNIGFFGKIHNFGTFKNFGIINNSGPQNSIYIGGFPSWERLPIGSNYAGYPVPLQGVMINCKRIINTISGCTRAGIGEINNYGSIWISSQDQLGQYYGSLANYATINNYWEIYNYGNLNNYPCPGQINNYEGRLIGYPVYESDFYCSGPNQPPEANAGGPYEGGEGTAIHMSGASASDPNNDPLTYNWNVNSESCSFDDPTVLQPNLTCNVSGDYTATLVVDDGTESVSSSATVTVSADTDSDGVPNNEDNAPDHYNPDQSDIDGDGVGDVADFCPNDVTNTCDPNGSAATYIDAEKGGELATGDGAVVVTLPPGAATEDGSVSLTETTPEGGSGFELTTNRGNLVGVFSIDLQPSQTFLDPVVITFRWDDVDNDGVVDGTNAQEENLIVSKDGVVITDKCRNEPVGGDLPDCDTNENTFTFEVLSWSEFALAYTLTTEQQIDGLKTAVDDLVSDGALKAGQAKGLLKPLNNALRSWETGNIDATCNQLQDFIDKTNQKVADGVLDQEDADLLIEDASALRSDDIGGINCS